MKYIAIIDDEMLSNFRIDDPLVMVVTDKMGFTRGIKLKPLEKGEWILQSNGKCKLCAPRFKCSNCGKITFDDSNYCPRCGAEMEGE